MSFDSLITILVSLIVGAGSSYITFRLQFERFKAMDERRELDWVNWRESVNDSLKALERTANVTELALIKQALEGLVRRVEKLEASG